MIRQLLTGLELITALNGNPKIPDDKIKIEQVTTENKKELISKEDTASIQNDYTPEKIPERNLGELICYIKKPSKNSVKNNFPMQNDKRNHLYIASIDLLWTQKDDADYFMKKFNIPKENLYFMSWVVIQQT